MGNTASSQETAGLEGPLVLIVDDHSDARAICETSLRAAGYRTVTAASGAEALASLETLHPALVLLDLAMPGVDGFAVARAIRGRQGFAKLPILVFTGLPVETWERARQAGGTAFCPKPIEPRHLLAEVRRLCPAGRDQ